MFTYRNVNTRWWFRMHKISCEELRWFVLVSITKLQSNPKIMPRKNFFLCPQEGVLLAADCRSPELESWKPWELLCGWNAQELLPSWVTSLRVCMMNGKVSEKNLFMDGVRYKRLGIKETSGVGSYWECCLQTSFFVDSVEIWCSGIKFISNTFQSRCDGCQVW